MFTKVFGLSGELWGSFSVPFFPSALTAGTPRLSSPKVALLAPLVSEKRRSVRPSRCRRSAISGRRVTAAALGSGPSHRPTRHNKHAAAIFHLALVQQSGASPHMTRPAGAVRSRCTDTTWWTYQGSKNFQGSFPPPRGAVCSVGKSKGPAVTPQLGTLACPRLFTSSARLRTREQLLAEMLGQLSGPADARGGNWNTGNVTASSGRRR